MTGAARPRPRPGGRPRDAARGRAAPRHRLSQNFLADVDVLDGILAEAGADPGRARPRDRPGARAAHGRAPRRGRRRDRRRARHRAGGLPARPVRRPRSRTARSGSIEGDALDQDLVAPRRAAVRRRRQPAVSHHEPDPARAARVAAAPGPARAHGPARGRRADRGAAREDELPVGLRAVPRPGADRLRGRRPTRSSRSRRSSSSVIVVEPFDARRPARAGRGGRALATRPGELPRASQDAPQRRSSGSSRSTRARVDAALAAVGIEPDRRPQTLAVGEWLALREALTPDRAGWTRPRPMSAATDPTRRLTPVVRLAPAKLNLTLAVVGHRPDGFHELHSVFVPLGLADRLSLAAAGGSRDTLHVIGLRPRAQAADNVVLRALAATRAAVGGGWSGGPGPGPGPLRPPREAHPGGGRPRRRLVRRGRHHRRGARGVGRDLDPEPAPTWPRASVRTCRSSRSGARRSSRVAASASRRSAGCAATRRCCS